MTCTFLQTLQRIADALQSFTKLLFKVGLCHDGAQLLADLLSFGQLDPPSLQL